MGVNQNFFKAKRFGDKLEKDIGLTIIKRLHKNCSIESPDDAGVYREDGLAIPDHIVKQNGKIVAMYDSKNKGGKGQRLYGNNDVFSCDEKVFQYQAMATKYNAPCYLIFYNKNYDKDNVYIANVNVNPSYEREVNNEYGDIMYGYHIHLTVKHSITKHNENIREQDMKTTWKATTIEEKKTLLFAVLDRCKPEQSYRPMDPKKITYFKNRIKIAKTPKELDQIIWNLYCSGKGMGLNSKNYNDIIKYA